MRPGKRPSRIKCRLLSLLVLSCVVAIDQFWSFYGVNYINPHRETPDDHTLTWPPTHTSNPYQNTTMKSEITHPNFTLEFPLCLVHVGKAGGSSISCGLGLMYANCEGMPRDALPHMHYLHLQRNTCPPKTTRTYLVTLRNPITRLRSWFNFEKNIIPYRQTKQQEAKAIKQRGRLFAECYSEFEDLALKGLRPLTYKISAVRIANMTCPERAWAAVLGARAFSYHEYYNYEHYYNSLQNHMGNHSSASIQVLRAEHLQYDWSKISSEKLFSQVNRGPNNHTKASSFTVEAMANLCRALCQEIQYYKRFLQEANNLSPDERAESIQEVSAFCPTETLAIRECSDIPAFPSLKISKGKYNQESKKRFYEVNSE
jgi:hypothetical protein